LTVLQKKDSIGISCVIGEQRYLETAKAGSL